jgi:hypothetical protein
LQTHAIEQQTIKQNTKPREFSRPHWWCSWYWIEGLPRHAPDGDSPTELAAQSGWSRAPSTALLLGALDLAGAEKMMCLALGSVDFLANRECAPNRLIQFI